jgi:ubiquinone/menaquinone biosynthesis C-methylase UbiE
MMDGYTDGEIKFCCATFYQSDAVRALLGDVLHPGGLELTRHLGTALGLIERDRVLDVACGRGASAVHLAEHFGCRAVGMDYGWESITGAQTHAEAREIDPLTSFLQGDAESLPFADGSFDAIISECSLCTFPNRMTAASEMARVLRPGGRVGLTDVTVNGPLPEEIQTLLAWVVCVAGTGSSEEYVAMLEEVGFTDFAVEDHRKALLEMANGLRRKLLGLELVLALGGIDLGGLDLSQVKRLARRALELIEDGTVGYTLITAKRG